MEFALLHKDSSSKARAGLIKTDHGDIRTPIFMPVGTLGGVKGVLMETLEEDIEAQIILANTYHLYLRPGTEVIQNAGGIHKFNSWEKPILTDSGGYQVYSLAESRKISEEGVRFQSHVDGSRHDFTPESAVDIQRQIGADFIMAFDECPPYPAEREYVEDSMHLTHRWLKRCVHRMDTTEPLYGYDQTLIPIIQGGTHVDLRKQSAEFIASLDRKANAIGGLSVGEPEEEIYHMTDIATSILPEDRPRYLMGVGTPSNLLECISLGVDMFDCVMPTRNGRNGMLFTSEGIINIRNEKWKNDNSPLDPNGTSSVDHRYSKSYVRHLMVSKEMLASQIASIHNLAFYLELMKLAREHIIQGDFAQWKERMRNQLSNRL
ncbi:MAG: tRNA guanosine(34) transglycosylase Tgt [Flavobacteriales bacterium]|nr:tRNA guanosine(34) transglycosylase Tgt [Flavobacteriales bacterium]NNK80038.1 tRNA guanosine(34) transglycosylase Tgt [Flavobacteriales bacterium]